MGRRTTGIAVAALFVLGGCTGDDGETANSAEREPTTQEMKAHLNRDFDSRRVINLLVDRSTNDAPVPRNSGMYVAPFEPLNDTITLVNGEFVTEGVKTVHLTRDTCTQLRLPGPYSERGVEVAANAGEARVSAIGSAGLLLCEAPGSVPNQQDIVSVNVRLEPVAQ